MRILFRCSSRSLSALFDSPHLHKTLSSSCATGALPVAVFWDLDNKPPNSIPPYDSAVRLRLAASSIGPLRFVAAYANLRAFRHFPAPVRAVRGSLRALHCLEASGAASTPSEHYICRVCGRKFFLHSKLLSHFKIHEQEHAKRLRRLDSATGARYVRLKAQLSLKMDKYRKVAREILIPKIGYGLGDELRRAGILVRVVEDRSEAADMALREHIMETIDKGRVGCLILVSDDAGFVGVIREAKMRSLKTVVMGDERDGPLKRCADWSFSWKDVISGKARKEAASMVVKWKDRDLLKKLEWRYQPESEPKDREFKACTWDDMDSENENAGDENGLMRKRVSEPWWKLD